MLKKTITVIIQDKQSTVKMHEDKKNTHHGLKMKKSIIIKNSIQITAEYLKKLNKQMKPETHVKFLG
jgi:predicted RNA-binding protein Jag